MLYIINMSIFFIFLSLFINYYYFLKSLIIVEFLSLSVIFLFMMSSFSFGHYVIYFLILSVCEGVLGLLLMVMVYRFWGSDYYILVDFSIDV